jgi:drug/metabolite transporter (DMT)-like permease
VAQITYNGPLLIAILATLWGFVYVLLEPLADHLSAGVVAAFRAGGAALILIVIRPGSFGGLVRAIRRQPSHMLLLALTNVALPFALLSIGEHTVSSSAMSVIVALSPALVALADLASGRGEPTHLLQWVGMGAATVGVAVTVGAGVGGVRSAWGLAAALGAAAAYAAGALVARWGSADRQPEDDALVTLSLGAAMLLVPALLTLPSRTPSAHTLVLLLVITGVTAISFQLLFVAVRVGGAALAIRPVYLSPAVAIAASAVFLGERVTVGLAVGFALTLGGVLLASRPPRAAPAAPKIG